MLKRRRLILFLLIVVAIVWFWRVRLAGPTVEAGSFLSLSIDGEIPEEAPTGIIDQLLGHRPQTVLELLQSLRVATADDRVAGIIARVKSPEVGWAQAEEIRAALGRFKASGKPLYAVIENEAAAVNLSYFIASVADRLYVAPASTAPLVGLAAQYLFMGGVWEKLDIEMNVERIGDYKTAADFIAGREMSAAHREMANWLLDGVDARFHAGIAEARGLDASQVRTLIDRGLARGEEFVEAGLADGVKFASDVAKEDAGGAPLLEFEKYAGVEPSSVGLEAAHTLAVVFAVGPIVTGESGNSLFGDPVVGADSIVEALEDAADDESAKAIVLRVNSPGGSALASDLIWRATQKAREKKPLVVSMSDVAGSGGYYIATGASRILAHETTLTGSIGVIFAKPYIRDFLNGLGITAETITRGRYAAINDLTVRLDEDLRRKIVVEVEHIYDRFVQRVAASRGMSAAEVDAVGRGRVWTGRQALERGLVDETGGFHDAFRAAKDAAGIPVEDEVDLVFYPRHKTLAERVTEALSSRIAARRTVLAELPLLREALRWYPFTEPGFLTVMPEIITIR